MSKGGCHGAINERNNWIREGLREEETRGFKTARDFKKGEITMSFFTREQKKLALNTDRGSLQSAYRLSEQRLSAIAREGNSRDLKSAMAEHQRYEYALLFTQTSEFKRKSNKRGKAKWVKQFK